jgi:hypothetical protein
VFGAMMSGMSRSPTMHRRHLFTAFCMTVAFGACRETKRVHAAELPHVTGTPVLHVTILATLGTRRSWAKGRRSRAYGRHSTTPRAM